MPYPSLYNQSGTSLKYLFNLKTKSGIHLANCKQLRCLKDYTWNHQIRPILWSSTRIWKEISQLSLWPLLSILPTAAWGAFSCHERILWGERVRVSQPNALPSHLGAFCIPDTFLGRNYIRMPKRGACKSSCGKPRLNNNQIPEDSYLQTSQMHSCQEEEE